MRVVSFFFSVLVCCRSLECLENLAKRAPLLLPTASCLPAVPEASTAIACIHPTYLRTTRSATTSLRSHPPSLVLLQVGPNTKCAALEGGEGPDLEYPLREGRV